MRTGRLNIPVSESRRQNWESNEVLYVSNVQRTILLAQNTHISNEADQLQYIRSTERFRQPKQMN